MREKLKRKLRSRSGETIAEVLIALLVSTIALVLLAGMLTSSTNIILRSTRAITSYYEASNDKLVLQPENQKLDVDGTLTLQLKLPEDKSISQTIGNVWIFENDALDGRAIYSFRKAEEAAP